MKRETELQRRLRLDRKNNLKVGPKQKIETVNLNDKKSDKNESEKK